MKNIFRFLLISAIVGVIWSCDPEDDLFIPEPVKTKASVETLGAENVTTFSAILSGEITDDGNCTIIAKGLCWAPYSQIPWFDSTRYGVSVIEGDDTYFRDTLSLSPGTKYYVRTFVKNEMGTTYGGTIIVTTLGDEPSFSTTPTVTYTDSSATITFAVENSELETSVTVKYGIDTNYGITVLTENIDSIKEYSITLPSLDYGTRYYYRVEIRNAVGWNYSTGNFQTATPATPDCVDIDGNVYKSVKIGDQIWITRNLDVAHYNDGTEIPYVESDEGWLKAGDDKMGARCYYNNDPELRKVYGTLYNWYAIDTQKLAPEGWHVPTNAEWVKLCLALLKIDGNDHDGYACREAGTAHWKAPNEGATNASGFTALPGGERSIGATSGILKFANLNTDGIWWSADELRQGVTRIVYTSYDVEYLYNFYSYKNLYGLSIRLVKD